MVILDEKDEVKDVDVSLSLQELAFFEHYEVTVDEVRQINETKTKN